MLKRHKGETGLFLALSRSFCRAFLRNHSLRGLYVLDLALFSNIEGDFQMKQRKGKASHPKKITLYDEKPHLPIYTEHILKEASGHTKTSTNYTMHSTLLPHQKKTKKTAVKPQKEVVSGVVRGLPTSKSSKKLKINLETRISKAAAQQSFREYCLVQQSFVPVCSAKEKQVLDSMLLQTASSTCDFNGLFGRTLDRDDKPILRRRGRSSLSRESSQEERLLVQKVDAAISARLAAPEVSDKQVATLIESTEIGMQYSARPSEEKVEQAEQIKQQIQYKNQSLSDLLLKLEFSHLADESAFLSLTSNEKQHFSQLLETFICKLKPKPQIKPISFPSDEECLNIEPYKMPLSLSESCDKLLPNYESIEKLVSLREYRQMNWIQSPAEEEDEEKVVNTSLFSVINFLCHLLCYIEVQYTEEFVYMIQKFYGHTAREKYRRITRGIPLTVDKRIRVVDENIFLDFINESNAYSNPNEIVHFKAIFDAFNEHLEEYRPFYMGNGEQFPWAFKMFASMSEYSITEDSLHIIFLQAKEKMIQWCSSLCGLLVEHNEKVLLPDNPLELKRNQKEQKMVKADLKDENFERDAIQLYSTQTLHQISEKIFLELLEELSFDIL